MKRKRKRKICEWFSYKISLCKTWTDQGERDKDEFSNVVNTVRKIKKKEFEIAYTRISFWNDYDVTRS